MVELVQRPRNSSPRNNTVARTIPPARSRNTACMAFCKEHILLLLLLAVWMVEATTPTTALPPSPKPSPSQPHIILIVADDLGWNDVSWHNSQVVTPHLEALARSGVLLEQSYVQPICTPTRSALLAGRYPFTIGRQHSVLYPMEPTGLNLSLTLLPQSLKAAGYSTHAVGKWHIGFCSWDYTPTKRGFDTFYGYYTGAEDYYTHSRRPSQLRSEDLWWSAKDAGTSPAGTPPAVMSAAGTSPAGTSPAGTTRLGYDFRNNIQPDHSVDGIYSTYLFASYIERLLSSRNPDDPMFLYLPFQSVHSPMQVPDNYTKPYSHIHHKQRRTKLGMVSAMDDAVGKLVTALKASGHYNNSIIVFTTDNGGPTVTSGNNWPLRGNKSTIWEGGTRGAAFVHSPLLPNPGTVSHQLLHVTDWYQTFMGLAGGVAPSDIDGVDQWAAITGATPSPRTQMIYNIDNTTHFSAGIRVGDYKLLVGDPGPGEWTPPPELTTIADQRLSTDQVISTVDPSVMSTMSHPVETEAGAVVRSTLDPNQPHLMQATGSSHDTDLTDPGRSGDSSDRVEPERTGREAVHQPKRVLNARKTFGGPFLLRVPLAEPDYEYDSLDEWKGVERPANEVLVREEVSPRPSEVADEAENITNSSDISGRSLSGGVESEETIRQLLELFNTSLPQIRLFNITADPEERSNLATLEVEVVKELLLLLQQQMSRYVPADIKPIDPHGNPSNWQNNWSPGWC
ncbi:arylsulfatase B-like isoform X2 [Panulirus ornatus]|uniref:arylsulfatase B-like isoform X2 n=1 Tax=Panulirus ornatus TaxID=150431 RepID=UPI003A847D40